MLGSMSRRSAPVVAFDVQHCVLTGSPLSADVLIESPTAFAGIHVAEALGAHDKLLTAYL
jgi:hypothetical protein